MNLGGRSLYDMRLLVDLVIMANGNAALCIIACLQDVHPVDEVLSLRWSNA
jgi:hypothetical protein